MTWGNINNLNNIKKINLPYKVKEILKKLGIKIENKELKIEPSIPKEWEGFSIQYKYKSSIYNIKYNNKADNQNNEKKVYVNGEEVQDGKIRLYDDGKVYNVEVKG